MSTTTELLQAVVTVAVTAPTFLACLLALRRLGLQPDTELTSVHQASHEVDRDLADRVAPILFYLALFCSLFVGFAVADAVV